MKALLYCTKAKPYLLRNVKGQWLIDNIHKIASKNGKIVGECDFEVEEIELKMEYMGLYYCGKTVYGWDGSLCEESQLDNWQLLDYLGDKIGDKGYAIHIKNLHIFDELHRLDDYFILNENPHILEKAPQNMCRVSQRFGGLHSEDTPMQDYILISIHPEWLCKILNGEKTIEVRKKVLKEMIK